MTGTATTSGGLYARQIRARTAALLAAAANALRATRQLPVLPLEHYRPFVGTGARGMHSALENVYESIVGALYLDAGFDVTHDFVLRTLEPHMSPELARKPISPKSRIQEVVQRDMHCAPEYKLLGEEGPAHDPTFTSVVMVDGRRVGKGQGSSKKSSESAAAADALVRMGYNAAEDFEGEGITN